MTRSSTRFLALIASALVALALASCGGDDATPALLPTATPDVADEGVVVVAVSGGCDRPQPELGTELLARVRVTYPDGSPVAGAQVDGEAEGPAVGQNTATDETYLDGEALLLFPVAEFGSYTMAVVRITLPDGRPAVFDPSSMLTTAHDIGETCVRP